MAHLGRSEERERRERVCQSEVVVGRGRLGQLWLERRVSGRVRKRDPDLHRDDNFKRRDDCDLTGIVGRQVWNGLTGSWTYICETHSKRSGPLG